MATHALVEGHMESVFLPVVLAQIGRADLRPTIRDAGGGPRFWQQAHRYNEAGEHATVLGLADVEQAQCAPALLAAKLPRKSAGFHLRLAVRMLESWLLADRACLAGFLRVRVASVPADPDAVQHPKRALVDLARRSTSRTVREALTPQDSGAVVGPEYVPVMSEFITTLWQAARARAASPSLETACLRWAAI